jgi:hypothetical protein
MLHFVMETPSPKTLRLDPAPSKAYAWIQWDENAPEIRDENSNRLIRPAGPTLTARFRSTGAEWEHWPVSEQEALAVMRPNGTYDYSVGRAMSQVIQPHKSKRLIKSGERQETKKQRAEVEKRAGKLWI